MFDASRTHSRLVDALFSHLAAGGIARSFRDDDVEIATDPQPILVKVAYDSNKKLVYGEANWDLGFMTTSGYINAVTLGIDNPPASPILVAASGNLDSRLVAGNNIFFNPALLPTQPTTFICEVSLLVLAPNKPAKFFSNHANFVFNP